MDMQIQDESNDRKYFTIIPNFILNHSTIWDREVYIQMKRISGENGTCWTARTTLARQCGMSLGRLKKSIQYLTDHKWIIAVGTRTVMTKGGPQDINEYKVLDLWKMNSDFYEKGGSLNNPPMPKGGSQNSQRGVTDDPKGGSQDDDKEEQVTKKIPLKEEGEKKRTPAQIAEDFFLKETSREEVVRGLTEKGISEQMARQEIKKFYSYWTESNKSGTKQRWQEERFFEIPRRLATWFGRIKGYEKPQKKTGYTKAYQ